MFTGLVEETGLVMSIERGSTSIRLTVQFSLCGTDLKVGDSLAVNGCCLTVVDLKRRGTRSIACFDLLSETWKRTNLQFVQSGSAVNLERSLPANGRIGGHFVTGHIDGMGEIARWEQQGADWLLEIAPHAEVMRYIVPKGAIAVDGISLTIAALMKKTFRIWIIPHTFQGTALRERIVGDSINLEADILGKYVERFVRFPKSRRSPRSQ
jgi:riboflavin synthase